MGSERRRREMRANLTLATISLTACTAVWAGMLPAWFLLLVVALFLVVQRGLSVIDAREQREERLNREFNERTRS